MTRTTTPRAALDELVAEAARHAETAAALEDDLRVTIHELLIPVFRHATKADQAALLRCQELPAFETVRVVVPIVRATIERRLAQLEAIGHDLMTAEATG